MEHQGTVFSTGLVMPVGEARVPMSARSHGAAGFGLASAILHAAVLGVLLNAVSPPLKSPPQEAAPVEICLLYTSDAADE